VNMALSINQQLAKKGFIVADWPLPDHVHAMVTTRQNPALTIPALHNNNYASFNLALHTRDDTAKVIENRQQLIDSANLPASPCWLNQVHGNHVADAETLSGNSPVEADACVSAQKNTVCAVMTADCLPVFFCNQPATEVAVAHAGWRGLLAGVLEQTVAVMKSSSQDLVVWFGPAIGREKFEVGEDVIQAVCGKYPFAVSAFRQVNATHYLCDIYLLARKILATMGITRVFGGDFCTYTQATQFYSYRRDGETGRMASLIWMQ